MEEINNALEKYHLFGFQVFKIKWFCVKTYSVTKLKILQILRRN